MAEPLAIITGIFAIVFLIFYLAFNLSKEHDLLKGALVVMGLVMLLFIPQQLEENNKDCGILSNGTYVCYLTNGSQVTDFGEGNTIGKQTFTAYNYFLLIVFVYFIGYVGIKLIRATPLIPRIVKAFKRKNK